MTKKNIGKKLLTVTERGALVFQYDIMAYFQRNCGPANSCTSVFVDARGVPRLNLSNYFDKYV